MIILVWLYLIYCLLDAPSWKVIVPGVVGYILFLYLVQMAPFTIAGVCFFVAWLCRNKD
jgi:hypothetical protein